MKKRIPLLLFLLIGIILADDSQLAQERQQTNFNVLLITIDTIRPDRLSCYSTKYLKTPHIDSLAAKGIVFDRAFAHNTTTLPSHTNILLGTTPLYHGVQDNSKFRVSEDFLTLAEHLKSKGYSTAAFIGAFPLDSRFGLSQGFDVYDDYYPSENNVAFLASERKAEQVIQLALDWLEKQDSKWFAWVHLWDPHALYTPPEPFNSQFKDDPYSGEVAYVDSELGKMLDYLEKNDLTENTLIILTGDHGESLFEHGEATHSYFAYNSTLWVPLIIAGPGISARRIDENVSHIDIFPSLCDILGIEKPSFLQGVSLLPLMTGGKIEKRAIYFESLGPHLNHGWAPLRGFIEENEKFIDSPLPEYYDLANDFNETKNIIDTISLDKYQQKQKSIEEKFSSPRRVQGRQTIDREALEKLRSLGYVDSPVSQSKNSYGEEDDLKTLLPIRQNLDKAIILYDGGKAEESIKLLNETIQQRKDFTEAYLYLYHVYKTQEQKEKALEILEEGMSNNPEHFAIVSTYGIYLVKERMWDKGIEVLQKSLSLVDFDPEVRIFLGLAYWRKGMVQKALEQYREALALDDSNPMLFSNLGALHLSVFQRAGKRADYSLSMEYFKKAIELDPNMIAAYKGLGAVYRSVGRIREAISVWELALGLNPKDNFLFINLGRAYLDIGRKAQALKYFENYLSLNKNTISEEERGIIEALIQKCKKE